MRPLIYFCLSRFNLPQELTWGGLIPPSVGVPYVSYVFSSGHRHVPGSSEQRGFKQERQHLSVRLACPQRHMPLPAHVPTCLEVPVEAH